MDKQEMLNLIGGYIPSEKSAYDYVYKNVVSMSNEEYPKSFRLKTTKVKNQQDKSTCVAHAITTMKEIQDFYDSNSTDLYSIAWIYLIRDNDQFKGDGMMIKEALSNLKNRGVVPLSLLPDNLNYTEGAVIGYNARMSEQLKTEALKHTIEAYAQTTSKDEVKHSLYVNKSPVIIGIDVYESFLDTNNNGIVKLPKTDQENNCGGHAMVIVGWTQIGSKEYWVVQNSWGESFGDNGYCYLQIDKFPINEMWTCIDKVDNMVNLTDIDDRWSTEYIKKCVRAGIISGFEDNTFRPTNTLTREQACAMICRVLDKIQLS